MSDRTITIGADVSGFKAGMDEMEKAAEKAGGAVGDVFQNMDKHLVQLGNTIEMLSNQIKEMNKNPKDNDGGGGGGGSGFGGGVARGVGAGLGLGSVMSVGGFISTMFGEGRQLDESSRMLKGLTGESTSRTSFMKTADVNTFARQSIGASSGLMSAGEARGQLVAERGVGLDTGAMSGFQRFAGMGGGTDMQSLMKKMANADLWDIKVDSKGGIEGGGALPEMVNQISQLSSMQAQSSETVSNDRSMQLMGMFDKVYAKGDSRTAGRIGNISQGISSGGGNDFMDAMIKQSIKEANPDASFTDIYATQQEGLSTDRGMKTLGSFLGLMNKQGMSQEMKTLGLMKLGGMTQEAAGNLAGLSKEDLTPQKIEEAANLNLSKKSKDNTGNVALTEVILRDALGKTGKSITDALGEHLVGMALVMEKLIAGKSIKEDIADGLESVLLEWGKEGEVATEGEKMKAKGQAKIAESYFTSDLKESKALYNQGKREKAVGEWEIKKENTAAGYPAFAETVESGGFEKAMQDNTTSNYVLAKKLELAFPLLKNDPNGN